MAFSTPLLLFCSLSSLSVLTSFLPPQLMPCPHFLQVSFFKSHKSCYSLLECFPQSCLTFLMGIFLKAPPQLYRRRIQVPGVGGRILWPAELQRGNLGEMPASCAEFRGCSFCEPSPVSGVDFSRSRCFLCHPCSCKQPLIHTPVNNRLIASPCWIVYNSYFGHS